MLKTAYTIYPTGRIGIIHSIKSEEKQVIELWRNSTISLGDPSYRFDGVAKGNGTLKGTVVADPSQCWKSDEFAGMQVNFPDWITYEILGNSATELNLGRQLTGGKSASDGSYWINSRNGKYGWLRCSDLQSPYSWQGSVSEYLREYWDPSTPEPYRNWTKASIMLVPKPDNPKQGGQGIHGWDRFKRFYYEHGRFDMNAGETITQFYMIQLGTSGDKLLPDLSEPETARIHAASYRNPATLEFSSGSAMDPAFDFGRASYKIRAAAGKVAFKITGSRCLRPVFEVKGISGDSPLKIQVDGETVDAVAARIDGETVIVQFLSDLESGATIEICCPPWSLGPK